ncbi:PepSY domain-containing protein [Acinetobacter sp.]|uniref:PepSY domain-containing protein n=1 Tax=Acinetobacter sp. TaxID=472 RepID=UPI00388FB17D
MLKKIFFQLHWFLGISAGLILSIMGVTGAIYSYESQILKWINQDSYVVQVENRPVLTPAEIYQRYSSQYPDAKINSITVAQDPSAAASVNVVKEGARRGHTIMINPYSAQALPEIQGRAFFQFIQDLHRNLTVGPVGKQITGASTLMLIFFVLSGLYLRWPKRHSIKQWLFVKPKLNGRNFIWDLHAVVGTWVVIFYLILACTGLYWSYDWWRNGMFKVLGVERSQPQAATPQGGQGGRAEKISPTELNIALTQSWQGFNQVGRDFSTLTMTLPKRADGQVSMSFFDAEPQHERARNNLTFNYQTNSVEKLELYEDKKLNEKIMSSMLPVHRGSFFGSVYQFMAMLASLAMPLFFITGWMLYLKRRKQKQLTQAARQGANSHALDANQKPWLIAYATQTGVSEQLAWRTASSLQEAQLATQVKAVQDLKPEDLHNAEHVLFIASTYGTGEAPDLATSFEKKLLTQHLNLNHLSYAVLALGSKEYPESYCSFGHRIAAWLDQNGAQALFNPIEVNNANPDDIARWNAALAKSTQLDLGSIQVHKVYDTWTLAKRECLNPNSLGQPAFNIELKTQHDITWEAGDIAEIQPGNSQARIDAFLQQQKLSAQPELIAALRYKDLSQKIHGFFSTEELLQQLPELPTREYSIASIPSQQILRLVVRQQQSNQQLGLGSGWLTEHVEVGQDVLLRIRSNPSFHLIADNRPVICIGNGTGIAGLMSLMQARIRLDYTDNWLIFGERQREHDFFYQRTIEAWQSTGMLKRIDLAFSRDQADKVYVHHKLREQASELRAWIDKGAVLYVCGSIQGMASDVDRALIDILGEACVDQLRETGRYRRDVY